MIVERPILMSGPMVLAILEDRKTQTRRVANTGFYAIDENVHGQATATREREKLLSRCPHGVPGDRLWVRESFAQYAGQYEYKASPLCGGDPDKGWKPSIHMPRAASRITLDVTGVRVERLQEITEDDADAEGCFALGDSECTARRQYQILWDSLNAKRGYSWQTNPWVWVLEFERTTPPAQGERLVRTALNPKAAWPFPKEKA